MKYLSAIVMSFALALPISASAGFIWEDGGSAVEIVEVSDIVNPANGSTRCTKPSCK